MPFNARYAVVVAALLAGACGPAVRESLPMPFAPIMGAVPISSEGIAIGAELADGLRGQEMQRTELTGVVLAGGIENLLGVSAATLRTSDDHVRAESIRFKLRVARPAGPRSAMAIHFGIAGADREEPTIQNERMFAADFALPFEVLATAAEKKVWLSAFVAPRLVVERYNDREAPSRSLTATFVGGSSGIHLRAWFLDLFAETTVARVPETVYGGVTYPKAVYAFPAISLMVRVGPSYDWSKR
jgi:hypothetical protein